MELRPNRIMTDNFLINAKSPRGGIVELHLWRRESGSRFERVGMTVVALSDPKMFHRLTAQETSAGFVFGFRKPDQSVGCGDIDPVFTLKVNEFIPLKGNTNGAGDTDNSTNREATGQ